MGVAFDGQNLWFSCASTPDLLRANPTTGAVSLPYTSGSGSGAIAYDGFHNGLWTSAGFGSTVAGIQFVQLDASKNPVSVTPAFDPGLGFLIDGIAYDAADNTLYISEDGAQQIHHYTTTGTFLDVRNWAQFGTCQNSGLAIGGNGLFQGANGCNHVWVTDKVTNLPLFNFDTTAGGGRDEGLSCDPVTFAPIEVMWSRDAFNESATAFEIPAGTCGVGGQSTGIPVVKTPRLANLWLCQPVASCANPSSGIGERDFNVELGGPVTSISPKGEAQTIGSFEFEVRYDRKLVNVTVTPGALFDEPDHLLVGGVLRSDVSCATTPGQGFVQFRCNVKGKSGVPITGPGTLAVVHVTPTADVYSVVIPSQENGIATQLINQDCQLSDLQGHPIATALCSDADVTLRYLEGDVNADCVVDVRDQQEEAFRWGSHTGQLLYNSRFDLEPAAPKLGDGDIDAHDLQVVYGRHGSTCGAPHPAQPPVDPKGTPVGTPTPTPPPTPVSAECPVKAGGGPMAAVGSTSTFTGTASVALCALNIAAPGLGAWTIDIDYDPAVVTVVNCVPFAGSVCNPHFGVVTIRDTGASATGLEGDTLLATIAFQCKAGGKSLLTPSLNVFADATIGNPQNIADATVQAGSVTCKAS